MLIFCSCVSLDWGNRQELEAACVANNEYNLIEKADLDDPKAAAKRLKREKQKQKRMGKQAKKRQDVVLDKDPNKDQDEVPASPSAPGPASSSAPSPASSPPVSPSASRSGPASSLLVSPSASRSDPAFFLPVFLSTSRSGPASSLPVSLSASRSGPALPLPFSLPASHFGPTSFPSHFGSPSPVSPTFTGRAFSPVVSRDSLVRRQSAPRARRYSSLPKKCEDNLVGPVKVPKKRSQEEVDEINRKRLRFQPMAATREEETVRLMFSYCPCTPEVKLNTDWQIGILSKSVCVVDGIASIAALHWVDNFWPYKKHMRLLAKRVGLLTRNVSLGELEVRLAKIWRNRESS